MTALVIGLAATALVQLGLQAVQVWWILGSCRPVLLVVLAASRRLSPVQVAWLGLVAGLLTDVLADRVIGPGGIAGAVAGSLVAAVERRLELQGPMFWVGGALTAAAVFDLVWRLLVAALGASPDHGWLGTLASTVTTTSLALLVALAERGWSAWRAPERRRRRALKQA